MLRLPPNAALFCALWLNISAPLATQAQAATASYDVLIDEALEASSQADWQRAHDAFARAHAAMPSARALRGMGVASFRMQHYAAALAALSASLSEPARPLSEDLRAGVERLIVDLGARVCHYALNVTPTHVAITVDGEPAVMSNDAVLLVDPGRHAIWIGAEKHEPRFVDVDCKAGSVSDLSLTLVPAASNAAEAKAAPASGDGRSVSLSAVADTTAADRSPGAARVVTWIAGAAVPVFALGTGLAWYEAKRTGDDLSDQCAHERCSQQRREQLIDESSLSTFETLTNVGWLMTAASAVTFGVSLFLWQETERPAQVSLELRRTEARMTVRF
jgi:hypothetical protein